MRVPGFSHRSGGRVPRTAHALLILFSGCMLLAAGPEKQSPQTQIDQAAKLIRHARDTENPADFAKAEAPIAKALSVDAENFDALRYRATVLLGEQDLPAALSLASSLNKRTPDDIGMWALLSAIHAAEGNYPDAERCAQWVLDLRRNSPLGFATAAKLREVFGDYEGAGEFYSEALRRTPQSDIEERAWLIAQMARTQLRTHNLSGAASLLDQAGKLFPSSVQTLGLLADLAHLRNDNAQAAALLGEVYKSSPTPSHLYAYAQALDRAGQHDEARAAYRKFEADPTGAGPELVFYYADVQEKPDKALAIAGRELSRRQDAATLDAYAWALYRTNRFAEAQAQIEKLLALGTRDPDYLCHSLRITNKAGSAASSCTETR